MEVILLHDISKLGARGDSVNVAKGYARNYLFPKGLAVRADTAKKRELEMKIQSLEKRDDRSRSGAEEAASKMSGVSLTVAAAASDEDKLYGSISTQMIASQLRDQGFEVRAVQILLDEPLRTLGSFSVPVRLHRDVTVEVPITVERA